MNRIELRQPTALLACVILAQPAFAQEAASASDQSSKNNQSLQEVVVTAEHSQHGPEDGRLDQCPLRR